MEPRNELWTNCGVRVPDFLSLGSNMDPCFVFSFNERVVDAVRDVYA
jgi:hypothetical protein